jgi:mono/diheme cytochrome c family protein
VTASAVVVLALVSLAAAVDAPLAVHDYLLSCAGCHKLDGSGSARVPSLRAIDRLLAYDGGRDYVLRVPGVAQAPLSDARLAAMLNWLFGHFGSGAPTPRFTAAEVERARQEPWRDPRAARAALN